MPGRLSSIFKLLALNNNFTPCYNLYCINFISIINDLAVLVCWIRSKMWKPTPVMIKSRMKI